MFLIIFYFFIFICETKRLCCAQLFLFLVVTLCQVQYTCLAMLPRHECIQNRYNTLQYWRIACRLYNVGFNTSGIQRLGATSADKSLFISTCLHSVIDRAQYTVIYSFSRITLLCSTQAIVLFSERVFIHSFAKKIIRRRIYCGEKRV